MPKMASATAKQGDPDVNEHIMYAKCIKGHVLKDANDWFLCENLPAPDSQCWQEGGDTTFSLLKKREASKTPANKQQNMQKTPQTSKS